MGDFFIRLDDASDLRRKILESSKAGVNVLRGYQQILKTRGEKRTMLKALRREMKELTMLINRLELLVPSLSKADVAELQPKAAPAEAPRPSKRSMKRMEPLPRLTEKKVYLGEPEPLRAAPKQFIPSAAVSAPQTSPKRSGELDSLHDKLASIEEKLRDL